MRIQNNISALNTASALKKNQKAQSSSLAKLSSGYSINKAADNAAGLAISEKMRGQIRGMEQASKNATDATNLVQTAEGYMKTTNDILQRMRELAVQAANGTYDTGTTGQTSIGDKQVTGDRAKINEEIQQLTDELDRIAETANFNGMKLSGGKFAFQVGADTYTEYTSNARYTSNGTTPIDWASKAQTTTATGFKDGTKTTDENAAMGKKNAEVIEVSIGKFDSATLGVKAGAAQNNANATKPSAVTTGDGIDLTTQAGANSAIDTINAAISRVTAERARLGAVQNRLDYTIDNLDTSIENTTASESAIRDTDMVSEMMEYTKTNVLNQAATAMMAQANTMTQSVLQLLQ